MSAADSLQIQAQSCADLIKESSFIVALTGAGISTSAGIPDFRGPQGLYVTRKYDPEKVFDIEYFHRDQKPFYQFARDFIGLESKIQPTPAHRFLNDLEISHNLKGIITQNIDSLHQTAGSKNVLEMHGSFWRSHCFKCGQEFTFEHMKEKLQQEEVPHCPCQGVIKPDIVFFGENVKYFNESVELAVKADLFFIIGTSCVVYPAAMLPQYTRGKIVIINKSEVFVNSNNVALSVKENIDEFFKKVTEVLS